jgi:competence protein ComEC
MSDAVRNREARLRDVAEAVRARPVQLCLGAALVGLLAAPRVAALVPAALALTPFVAGRPGLMLAAAAALLCGATLADARLAALERTALTPQLGHAMATDVTLLEAPRQRAFGVRVAVAALGDERVLVRAPAHVAWPRVGTGAVVFVRGALGAPGPRDGYLRPRHVHAILRAESIRATGRRRGGVAGLLDAARARAENALDRGLGRPEAALARGMALGQDEALDERTRDRFRASGLSHLVAASGQNVALLAALVFGAAALVGVGLRARLVAALALIALYVPLAGAGPSIQRAGVMGGAGTVALLLGRPAARWHALLLAAVVTLILNPSAPADPGWQLSFAAVVAILLIARPVGDALRRRGAPGPLADGLALTLAATLGTAPIVAAQFERLSLVSVVANVAVVPAVAPVMWLGIVAAALGQMGAAVGAPVAGLATPALGYIEWVAETAARAPAAQIAASPLLVSVLALAVGAAVMSPRARVPGAVAAIVALVVAGAVHVLRPAGVRAPQGLRVTFLDVGQGDATLLQHRSTAVLVDTGPPGGPIVDRLRHAGVRRLDLLVVTHAQADHLGAGAAIVRALPVGLLLDGRDGVREPHGDALAAEARRRGVPIARPRAGEVLRAGGLVLRVLWPVPEPRALHAGGDPNERAIVAEARAGATRVLLTADAESDVLSRLDVGAVDVLKVSHHGSVDEGLPALLQRLRPRLAAIEVGRSNTYGHPSPSTIAALRAAGAKVVRTDRDGTVRVEPRGDALEVTGDG